MRRSKDGVAGGPAAPVDDGLELRMSAQPGPVFVPGASHYVPAGVVASIRHMLTRMITSDQWPQAVALTSARRGEGVTHTALALSAVLAQDTGKPVCLVDANWYWPSATVADGAAAGATGLAATGLAAVLDGALGLDEALVIVEDATGPNEWQRDGWWRLNLLPAGRMPPARRVIAARSAELKAVVAELRKRFEYIVLDLPAVLATSDAIALAGLADASCLVVHQGVTPAATVQEALAAIRHLPVAGVILNHVRVHMPAGLAGQLTAPLAAPVAQDAG
jgi:Mrp family chromosome partitioning ATPase